MKIELVEGAKRPSLPEAPPVKRDQPLPVALGGRLVVTPTVRKRETVMNSWIEFDLTGGAGPPERARSSSSTASPPRLRSAHNLSGKSRTEGLGGGPKLAISSRNSE
jgi:hypothetical protein